MSESVRIGAGLGFYGDSWMPIRDTIEKGEVQYIGSDHLAELTLAILQKDRMRDPKLGYCKDLIPLLRDLYPLAHQRGIKFLLNAGGLNPQGAGQAVIALLQELNIHAKVAVVTGDALLDQLTDYEQAGAVLNHMVTETPIESVRSRLVFANAYLGAQPMVTALAQGADIVITGRVADAALFLAPLIYEFKWEWQDWDRLAQGLLVGHLLECSGQGSGGNFGGDWQRIADLAHIGYPIAEVHKNGQAIITKAPSTGGEVSFDTVRQQLLYEIQDPHRYVLPDAILDLSTTRVEEIAPNRVEIKHTKGHPAPRQFKVVAGYEDGFMAQGSMGYAWPDAYAKAKQAEEIIRTQLKDRAFNIDEIHTEFVGVDSLHGPLSDYSKVDDANEVYLKMSLRTQDKNSANAFGRLFPPLVLSGPPFVGGFGGMAPVRQLLGIWPTLIDKSLVTPNIEVNYVCS
ncbi:MAG TPA: DUF1446 domain-containing protein [Gammaproteobacteria bacterium]|nr:DUF1446 domain-containing protein [Gammaproteobacteria bacterium]